MSAVRLNPQPWTDWSEWHNDSPSKGWDDWTWSGLPPDGLPHWIRAYDYGNQKLLAITRQKLLYLLDKDYRLKFRVAIESVDQAGFLRCTMVVRLDQLNPDGSIPAAHDDATALYTEYDFFTGENTHTQAVRRFKFIVVGQISVDGTYYEFDVPMTQDLINHWEGFTPSDLGYPIDLTKYYIRYIAPTIEATNGGAKIWVEDIEIYEGGEALSLEYKNEDDAPFDVIRRTVVISDETITIAPGETKTISIGPNQILVNPSD